MMGVESASVGQPATSVAAAYRDALFALLLLLTVVLGAALAWERGYFIDDHFQRRTVEVNAAAIDDLLNGRDDPLKPLEGYASRYYGVGFHALGWPVRLVMAPLHERYQGLSRRDSLVAAQHMATFLFFLFGGFAFHRILRLAALDPELSRWATLFFLSNPYLLGHGTMNVKDAPFMVAWLLCTWRLLVPCVRFAREGAIRRSDFVWLGIATAFLLSIRISGLLIGIQYLVAFAFLLLYHGHALRARWREAGVGVAYFATATVLGIWVAYPIFWPAPWRIIDAARYMGHYPWSSCTPTWGQCLPAQDLPWFYIPAWMVVKVALLGLVGLVLALTCLRRKATDATTSLMLPTLLVSLVLIVAVLIATGAHLYNEIRQVMFLVPLVYVIAFIALDRWRRVGIAMLAGSLFVAAFDNAFLYPYQYVWFNEPARVLELNRDFITDYEMQSSREVAMLAKVAPPLAACIYVRYPHQYRPFQGGDDEACILTGGSFWNLPVPEMRPYLIHVYASQEAYGSVIGCKDVVVFQRRLLFAPTPMRLSSLQLCQ